MKILWVKADFLHPVNRGGKIRTFEMLRRLHGRHEIHYVGLADPAQPEGPEGSGEYCSRAYPVPHHAPPHGSPAFAWQVAAGVVRSLPVAVSRYRSRPMERLVDELMREGGFDRVVCDFLAPACNIRALEKCVLFQHNVETMIWRRHVETAADPFRKWYFERQAERMFAFERDVSRAVAQVVTVSPVDAALTREMFCVTQVSEVPTGVDVESFMPPASSAAIADVVFVGAMDWLPNIDGVRYFTTEILPLIRRRRPECTFAIVGRTPAHEVRAAAAGDAKILVTGTVPDVRPYFWGSRLCVVPLRIGGGTRLKIYEAMAAGIPVVSTSIGAEGLCVEHGRNICLADTPEAFAEECVALLEDAAERRRLAAEARAMVESRFSWRHVAEAFERVLENPRGSA